MRPPVLRPERTAGHMACGGTDSRCTGQEPEGPAQSHKLLGFLPLICLISLLLHDLQVPLLPGSSGELPARGLPLTEVSAFSYSGEP